MTNTKARDSRLGARAAILLLVLATVAPLGAHVGSPDVFVETDAGPYHLFVTVRPPRVIPGVAEVEILTTSDNVTSVQVVPTPITGAGAKFAPAPAPARPQNASRKRFTADLWMMTAGAWEVRVTIDGAAGRATTAVPVPTLPQATLAMSGGLQGLLFGLMALLVAGFVSIIAAITREATLPPGEMLDARRRRRGRIALGVSTVGVLGLIAFGNWWWGLEAARYDAYVYKPLGVTTTVRDSVLDLTLTDPGWIALRRLDDLVPDHGHLMHLFVVSPTLDRLWHLHPQITNTGSFSQPLPAAPAGRYTLFADVVHASGISETAAGSLELGTISGQPVQGDDAEWSGPATMSGNVSPLADGGRMTWVHDAGPVRAKALTSFTFRIDDASGQPATDLELYMGMPAHAVFIRRDGQVFAHVHPSGSAPMAALEISQRTIAPQATGAMEGHMHHDGALPAVVSFPYGIPSPGDYRIFVQVKRSGRVVTGVFDARVQ